MNRAAVIAELADTMAAIHLDHPVRVGIDGVDASGKTTLANELIEPLKARGRNVVRVSVDGFHNPGHVRRRQGPTAPRGYYEDSFDHESILSCVLRPLGPGGDRRFKPAIFDFRTDSSVDCAWQETPPDAVLIFEGVFLHRPELREHWDFTVFVHADFNLTLQRAQQRDVYLFGSAARIREMYLQRYIPGQQLYLEAEKPAQRADIVFDNTDLQNPTLKRNEAAIRPARLDELDRLIDIVRAATRHMESQGIRQWDDIYPDRATLKADIEGQHTQIIEARGRIAGMISIDDQQLPAYQKIQWQYPGKALVVHRLTIDPSCQRQGLATRLMRFAEKAAERGGYQAIRFDAFTQNPGATALYEKLGYEKAGTIQLRKGLFFCFEKPVKPTGRK